MLLPRSTVAHPVPSRREGARPPHSTTAPAAGWSRRVHDFHVPRALMRNRTVLRSIFEATARSPP